ncbi:MAG: ComF family protein [Candidatus Pacebacteria bacterium]|nr:ComF family protein [Candidatus Paceibacterota bacterium]
MFKKWKTFFLDLLFPQFCLNCQKEGSLVCPDCLATIDINPFQYCPFCFFPNRVIKNGKCQSHQTFQLNGLFSAVSYQDKLVKKMVSLFKYEPFIRNLCQPLAFLIISHFMLTQNQQALVDKSAVFIPVPITTKKLRKRGYNQSAVVAKILSIYYGLDLQTKNLMKIKNTQDQVGLSRQERQHNIFGAFVIKNPDLIAKKTIFLVDDVFTTGATMEECARVLKANGAKKVYGIAIAREGLEK